MSIKVTYTNLELKENDSSMRQLKELIARDASWGTHTENLPAAEKTCGTGAADRWKQIQPKVSNHQDGYDTDKEFSLTFPKDNFNFERESVDHFVGTVAGDIVLNSKIKSIEVKDFNFEDDGIYKHFPGPNVGVDNLYNNLLKQTLGDAKRPILAFTVKPRNGLNIDDYLRLFEAAAKAEVDIIEDDERLVDSDTCPFEVRVKKIRELQNGNALLNKTVYSVNITGDSQSALEKLKFCAKHGIKMVKIDVLVSGFETLRKVAWQIRREYGSNIAITVYPDAYLAYRKLSRDFILKLSRLCGADIIYAGSFRWARFGSQEASLEEAVAPIYQRHQLLSETISTTKFKATLPTITNDESPSTAELLTAYFRNKKNGHYKYAFFVGGGISGFPDDVFNAAKTWKDCLIHASTVNLDAYTNFAYDNNYLNLTKQRFKETDWAIIDIKSELNKNKY